jgi:hypothetical protein
MKDQHRPRSVQAKLIMADLGTVVRVEGEASNHRAFLPVPRPPLRVGRDAIVCGCWIQHCVTITATGVCLLEAAGGPTSV